MVSTEFLLRLQQNAFDFVFISAFLGNVTNWHGRIQQFLTEELFMSKCSISKKVFRPISEYHQK